MFCSSSHSTHPLPFLHYTQDDRYFNLFATPISSLLAVDPLADLLGHGKRNGSAKGTPITRGTYLPGQFFSSSPELILTPSTAATRTPWIPNTTRRDLVLQFTKVPSTRFQSPRCFKHPPRRVKVDPGTPRREEQTGSEHRLVKALGC